MRRLIPSLVFLVVLMTLGGVGIYATLAEQAPTQGYYLPTLNPDPATGGTQGLLLLAVIGGAVLGSLGLALALALTFDRISRWQAAQAAAPAARAAAAKPAVDAAAPLLSDRRSLAIFWVVFVIGSVSFVVLRYWGQPLGYLPPIVQAATAPVLRLPGEPIPGLPEFIAGPGDDLLVWQLALGVLGFAVAGTAALGFGLAWLFGRLDATLRVADQLPKTAADRLAESAINLAERQVAALKSPRPKSPPRPVSWVDQGLMLVNGLLLIAVVVILAVFTAPQLAQVSQVNQAIQATQAARDATPTSPAAAPVSPEAVRAELAALPAGDAAAGQTVFTTAGCAACHSMEPDVKIVGPSLANVAVRAKTRKADYTPEMYLYESITNPNAYVVETFEAGLMPQSFKQTLSPQDLANVIAYLLAQQ